MEAHWNVCFSLRCITCLFLLHLSFVPVRSQHEDLELVKLAVKSNRLKLKSAVANVNSTETELDSETKKTNIKTNKYFIAFSEGKIRFDKIGPSYLSKVQTNKNEAKPPPLEWVERFHWKYFKNGLTCAIFHDNNRVVIVEENGKCSTKDVGYFDIKAIGLYTAGLIVEGCTIEEDFEKLFPFNPKDLIKVEKTPKENWIFTFEFFLPRYNLKLRRILNVDTKNGFTPISLELYLLRNGSFALYEKTKTLWTNINSIWVPTRTEVYCGGENSKIAMDFKWSSINKIIDEKFFTIEDLHIPKTVSIATRNNGRLRIVQYGQIGEN